MFSIDKSVTLVEFTGLLLSIDKDPEFQILLQRRSLKED